MQKIDIKFTHETQFPKRLILAAINTRGKFTPKDRLVEYDKWVPNDLVYWWGNGRRLRILDISKGVIFMLDYEKGWPHIKPRRVLCKK